MYVQEILPGLLEKLERPMYAHLFASEEPIMFGHAINLTLDHRLMNLNLGMRRGYSTAIWELATENDLIIVVGEGINRRILRPTPATLVCVGSSVYQSWWPHAFTPLPRRVFVDNASRLGQPVRDMIHNVFTVIFGQTNPKPSQLPTFVLLG